MFIGRKLELETLSRAHQAAESAFIPIYGRRRIGKTELILQFLEKKLGVYLVGKLIPEPLQIREFLNVAADTLQEPILKGYVATDWGDALDAVVSKWPTNKKCIIVLDEFQWVAGASPGLPSILQEKWDRVWKKRGDVILILCGSFVGFMEREVLGRKSPLFGRRTAQIHLKPFNYLEAAQFFPNYSTVDKAQAYFICGGVPMYLRHFSTKASIQGNIVKNIMADGAPLQTEGDFLLREELSDVEHYYAVLLAIANGHHSNRDIADASGLDPRALNYFYQQLIELGYIRKQYPLTGAKPVARNVRYQISDPFLRFWFRFVYPNTSYIRLASPEVAFANRIKPHLDSYFGHCFELLCREALGHVYLLEGVTSHFDIGEYWDKHVQIDVVGFRADGWTDLCECKWGRVHSRKAVEDELKTKVTKYPNPRNATIGRRIFCRSKPKARPKSSSLDYGWCDLNDLYGAED